MFQQKKHEPISAPDRLEHPFIDKIREHPDLYQKWLTTWTRKKQRQDPDAFLADVLKNLNTIREKYIRADRVEECRQTCDELRKLQRSLRDSLKNIDLPCSQCGGWCCGWHMGNNHLHDPIDLMFFAFNGVCLTDYVVNKSGPGCLFLGKHGCSLPSDTRPRVCVTFFCSMVRRQVVSAKPLVALKDFYARTDSLIALKTKVTFAEIVATMDSILDHQDKKKEYNVISAETVGKRATFRIRVVFKPDKELVSLYVYYPVTVPEKKRMQVCEAITRINYNMLYGWYEMDMRDGELRFRSFIPLDTAPFFPEQLKTIFYAGVSNADRYFPALMSIIHGGKTVEQAISTMEA